MKALLYSCLLLYFVVSPAVFAGEKDDLKKVNQVYEKMTALSMNVTIETYTRQRDLKPQRTYKGFIKRSGQFMYSSIMGRTMIYNKELSCFVDDDNKLIIVSDPAGNKEVNKMQQQQVYDDSSWFNLGAKYKYLLSTPEKKKIEITMEGDTQYDKVELTLNAKTFFVEEVVYYYSSEKGDGEMEEENLSYEKIKVKYENINASYKGSPGDFSAKAFISADKKDPKATPKYDSYKVIDQRTKK